MRPRERPRHEKLRELLFVEKGSLGSIPACTLDIRPLTVLVGQQGTGKSLLAQALYFFRECGPLVREADAINRIIERSLPDRPHRASTDLSTKHVRYLLGLALDSLRSPYRRFAVFANPKVTLRYASLGPDQNERDLSRRELLSINLHRVTRQALSNQALADATMAFMRGKSARWGRSLFVPTERLIYSQMNSAGLMRSLPLPTTFHLFSDWMERASAVMSNWPDGVPESEAARWIMERGREVLGGEAHRHHDAWKWQTSSGVQLDIDMASSGQRANWPLFALAAALCSLRADGRIARGFTLIIEEPEIHLHPGAQRSLMEVLAFLVNEGFGVVVTTHSLVGGYTLNNLLVASSLNGQVAEGAPEPRIRLRPDDVAVYLLQNDVAPAMILDREKRFIDEAALGRVSDQLGGELNRTERAIRDARSGP